MNENTVASSIEEVKGAAKDAIGWAVSDTKLQSEWRRRQGRRRDSELW